MKILLDKLNIKDINPGACTGSNGWIDTKGPKIVSYNPATGEPIAAVRETTKEEYRIVAQKAENTFKNWRAMPAPKRGEVVRDLGEALREYKEPLGDLIALEMGKIRSEGHGEVQEMIDMCDLAVGFSRQLYGATMHSERPGHRMYEQWHPLGPVGIITAFNFPVAVWAWNAAVAAVCGDTVVWKPSELTPLTAIAVQHITNRVMADHGLEGVFTLAIGGAQIGEAMARDKRLPLISFTGSVETGWGVAETVVRRHGEYLLELGGNNAIIVEADADIELAVRAIAFGAVGTAGQRCTSTRRVIAHASIAPELTDRLMKLYKKVPVGNPMDEGTLMGPLINEKAVGSMMAALKRAEKEGGNILCGGRRLPELGATFVEPAVVKMPKQTPLMYEETFAPVLYIVEYEDLDEAITIQNAVTQGLSSAIFTTNVLSAEKFLSVEGSDCGIANVNIGTSGAEIGGAFGGEKDTGGGREAGSDAWKAYMRRQTNTINYSKDLPLAQGVKFDVD